MVNKELLKEIEEYCKLNELDVRNTINIALIKGFTIEKYGETPTSSKKQQKVLEVIKTVEKIVEVEKIVKVSDDTKVNELLEEISKLTGEADDLNELISQYKEGLETVKGELKECNENSKKDIYGE